MRDMKTKLLFWGAVLFLVLGLNAKDGTLFYFFSIHQFMLFVGVLLRQRESKRQPQSVGDTSS
jgi:hypothetical protein